MDGTWFNPPDVLSGHDYQYRKACGPMLGSGTFGQVHLYVDECTTVGEQVAIKFVKCVFSKYTRTEIVNHRRLRGHPNVIQFKVRGEIRTDGGQAVVGYLPSLITGRWLI